MMRPPVAPVRVEPLLLTGLREAFPDILFTTVKGRHEPPYSECLISAEPQQLVTSITQRVTLRLSMYVARESGSGDWQSAQRLLSDVERYILSTDWPQIVGMEHSSGPMRIADDEAKLILAYSLILLDVLVR